MIGDNPAAVASLALSGGWLTTKTLLKGPGGSFTFTGGGLTAETVGFDLVNQGGLIAPSRGTGAMRVMGDLTLESGSLLLEIRGTQNSQHDRVVVVDGALAAGGMLDVVLNGYTAVAGDVFDLVAIQGSGALNTGGYRPGPPAVPVPEPASGLVVAMVASLGCWSGSRRRRG